MKTSDKSRRIAIVTGAARGIGRAVALKLGHHNYQVVVNDVEDDSVITAVVRELHAAGATESIALCGDVADAHFVEHMLDQCVARLGVPTAVVCNAGIERITPFLDISEKEFDRVLAVNLKGEFLVGRACAQRMVAAQVAGSIVNVASVQGLRAVPGRGHYGPSKAAILQLTRQMSIELATHQIRVNAVAPGLIATSMTADALSNAETRGSLLNQIPMGRAGEAEEIAEGAYFLLSDRASYVTGTMLLIDGGMAA